jgi:hypothetical protein
VVFLSFFLFHSFLLSFYSSVFILFLIPHLFFFYVYLFILYFLLYFFMFPIFIFLPSNIFPSIKTFIIKMRCKFILARIISRSGYKYLVRAIITTCSDSCSDLF